MATYIEVTGAYNRDYKNQAAVKADWKADKDFQDTSTGQYTNRSDCTAMGLKVIVRYDRNLKVVAVN